TWTTTSLVISCKGLHRQLLHVVCWAPVAKFTEKILMTACECWQWLLSARSDLMLPFLQEMLGAWQCTLETRIGIFSPIYPSATLTKDNHPTATASEIRFGDGWMNTISIL
ncbi:unnamed protein product, partial [Allacma fusca]